jgi:TM2 domain-containing membrane protein YozV
MALIKCPECGSDVSSAAASCPACGHPIRAVAPAVTATVPQRKWIPGVAAVLSLVIPGAGQMYKGQVFNGLLWLIFVVIGYAMFVVPGVILHICCIIGAASGDPTK